MESAVQHSVTILVTKLKLARSPRRQDFQIRSAEDVWRYQQDSAVYYRLAAQVVSM